MKRSIFLAIVLIVLAAGAYAAYRFSQAQPIASSKLLPPLDSAKTRPSPVRCKPQASSKPIAYSYPTNWAVASPLSMWPKAIGRCRPPLLAVDDSLLQARAAQADASIAEAEAQLALLQAGVRAEAIAQAQAQLAQTEIDAEVAEQAWDDAKPLRERPDDLDLGIIEAETALAEAEHQAKAARLQAEAADLQNALWGRATKLLQEGFDVSLPFGSFHVDKPADRDQANAKWNVSGQQAWSWQTAYAADDTVAAARTTLADLRRQRGSLIGLDAQVNQAEAAYQRAFAGIDQARAAVQGLEEGATVEEIEVARQAVEQARVGRAALEVNRPRRASVRRWTAW